MNIDVSIIIVHWNVPALLDACLRSIAVEQARAGPAGPIVDTLVVDNNSPGAGFAEVMARHPWARTLALSENRGFAAGANAGIAASRGEALLLLNPDVELRPHALERLWTALRIAQHIGMVAPLLFNADDSLQSQGYRFPGLANVFFDLVLLHPRLAESPLNGRMPLGDGATPLAIDYPLGAAMLVRRAALEQVGLLDEGYGMYSEEIDWARRLRAAGWTILLTPAARVVHHSGQSTRQRPAAMRAALWRSRARYFVRWGTPRQRRWLPPLMRVGLALADRHAADADRAANDRLHDACARLPSGNGSRSASGPS